MAYPFGIFIAAQAIVSLTPDTPADIAINNDEGHINLRETIADDFLYLLVTDATERQRFDAADPTRTVTWCYENSSNGRDGLVAAAAASSPDGGHAYLAGEVALVSALKAALLGRGWSADQVSAKAYWNRGRANAGHGEPEIKA